ncbi:hypothetical protein BDQ17DRAFT_1096899 [Cyathus striatus]|nr:hypothetical protein BDQ17DRAFT_1096899 [Cyathus striatus]
MMNDCLLPFMLQSASTVSSRSSRLLQTSGSESDLGSRAADCSQFLIPLPPPPWTSTSLERFSSLSIESTALLKLVTVCFRIFRICFIGKEVSFCFISLPFPLYSPFHRLTNRPYIKETLVSFLSCWFITLATGIPHLGGFSDKSRKKGGASARHALCVVVRLFVSGLQFPIGQRVPHISDAISRESLLNPML